MFITLCLLYTYFAFTFLPTSIIGEGDGFDLSNMITPDGDVANTSRATTHQQQQAEIVPRVLHQVRLGDLPMRPEWTVARQSCIDLHTSRNWTIKLWDDETANSFVLEHYPHLFDMYRGYLQGELLILFFFEEVSVYEVLN